MIRKLPPITGKQIKFDEEFEEECCATPEIVENEDGMRVCANCGLVLGQAFVSSEKTWLIQQMKSRIVGELNPDGVPMGPEPLLA